MRDRDDAVAPPPRGSGAAPDAAPGPTGAPESVAAGASATAPPPTPPPPAPAPAPMPTPVLSSVLAPAASSRGPSSVVDALLVMLDGASDFGVVELERLLASLLKGPALTPAEERVAQLSALTQLLESELAVSLPLHPIAPLQVARSDYDATRPPGAPSAETLVELYGTAAKDGWAWACRAAWGLLPDGRKTKPGMGWPSTLRGGKRAPRSDRDMVVRSIRECAFALLRRPTSNVYIEWLNAQRRRSKQAGGGGGQASQPRRRASIRAVYQQFPRGWASALAAADITDAELAAARAELLAARSPGRGRGRTGGFAATGDSQVASPVTAADRLAELDPERLAALGIGRARDRLVRKGFGELPISQAAAVAHELGGSLEWLAGTNAQPGEPADMRARFDPNALRGAAKRNGVKLEALRAKARLDVSGSRAVLSGKREPTLDQVKRWATALRVTVDALLAHDTGGARP